MKSSLVRSSLLLPRAVNRKKIDNSALIRWPGHRFKTVVTIHDLIVFKFPQFFTQKHALIIQSLVRLAIARADHIIVPANSTKTDLLYLFPRVSAEKITVVLSATADSFRPQIEEDVQVFKERRGLPNQYLLSLGTYNPARILND